jgi:hypothetical protein
MESPAGQIRRVCVNVEDPMPAVVSFGVHALTQPADGPVLRVLTVDNWNHDSRELWQIPEAREWFAQLWRDGKRLLRVLSESTGDMPPDDRLGLTGRELSQVGFGWWDAYVVGMCHVDVEQLQTGNADGPMWQLAAVAPGNRTREEIRAELLQMSPEQPEGYTFDDATARRVFGQNNMPAALAASRSMGADADTVVLVLSLLDPVALKLARVVVDESSIQNALADCKRRDLHPAAVVGVPRHVAAEAVQSFAPGAAQRMAGGRPETGWHWGVFVANNGSTLAVLDPPAMEGTS